MLYAMLLDGQIGSHNIVDICGCDSNKRYVRTNCIVASKWQTMRVYDGDCTRLLTKHVRSWSIRPCIIAELLLWMIRIYIWPVLPSKHASSTHKETERRIPVKNACVVIPIIPDGRAGKMHGFQDGSDVTIPQWMKNFWEPLGSGRTLVIAALIMSQKWIASSSSLGRNKRSISDSLELDLISPCDTYPISKWWDKGTLCCSSRGSLIYAISDSRFGGSVEVSVNQLSRRVSETSAVQDWKTIMYETK